MNGPDVVEVLDRLRSAGVRHWVDGGWGVDALLGEQTREHEDLDLVVEREECERAAAILGRLGFVHDAEEQPGLPARFVLSDPRGRRVDLHPVVFGLMETRGNRCSAKPGAHIRTTASRAPVRSRAGQSRASPPSCSSAITWATPGPRMTVTTWSSSPSASACRFRRSRFLGMGKAGDWLKEERRKTLGDWVAVCLSCGYAQRYFEEWEAELPAACPQCEGELRWRCPSCSSRFTSAFAVECEACGGELRPPELFGTPIHKRGR